MSKKYLYYNKLTTNNDDVKKKRRHVQCKKIHKHFFFLSLTNLTLTQF